MNENLIKAKEKLTLFEKYKESEEFKTVKDLADVLYNERNNADFKDILEEALALYSFELYEIGEMSRGSNESE